DGPENRPGGAALRRQRLRLPDDGRERRVVGRHHLADDAAGNATAHRRRGLPARAAPPGLHAARRGRLTVPDVLIVVGSESDKARIEPAFDILKQAAGARGLTAPA